MIKKKLRSSKLKNRLHGVIRKSKRSYYYNKFEKVKYNMRETWKTINNVIGHTQKQSQTDQFKGSQLTKMKSTFLICPWHL